ncbi:aldolase/citrate lyase family protein [Pannus brasiliensis CCIBt3594]|uniref:Aldolase/citrate lyase family protein n=1 Tax=Pannus brasiliensis CCIBt3594 TaxID=1427578 RepID=A0AAW9QP83_9CHRO
MNRTEKRMLELLDELRERYHVIGVKAEFETEGTRLEEASRLREISREVGLDFTLKIGGCGAIKDLFEAIDLGVDRVVAPMVETAYALQKYLLAIDTVFARKSGVKFSVNLETITAFKNLDEMLSIPEITALDGIVIGRSDLAGSMGLSSKEVEGEIIGKLALEMAGKAKTAGLEVAIGGGISFLSLPFLKTFPVGQIDRFETRKVVFRAPEALENPAVAFQKALEFEILWLKNKQHYYGAIDRQDEARLATLEERYRNSIEGAL